MIQALLLVAAPALVMVLAKRVRVLGLIGPTLLCYVLGISAANLGLPIDRKLSLLLAEVAVLLAIPLLLFSTDFVRWLRLAKSTVLSFLLACVSVMVVAAGVGVLFAGRLPEGWQLAGMYVGVYTGGTANMSAIGLALGVREETFVLANAADVVMSGLYLIFLMTIAQRVLLKFLPPFKSSGGVAPHAETTKDGRDTQTTEAAPTQPVPVSPFSRARLTQTLVGVGVAVLIVAASVGLALLLTGGLAETFILLTITTLGIAASLLPKLRRLEGPTDLALYLLLVFCVSIGTIANFRELTGSPAVFAFCGLVVAGAVVLHYFLAALFRIDADTVIITSTAAVFSPPFVGPIAAVLRNPEIVVSGLTTGLVGYAVGNYLGIAVAYLLKP